MVHVSGKYGGRNGAACPDRARRPWDLADAGASGQHRDALHGEIYRTADPGGDPDGDDDGDVLFKRSGCFADAGLRVPAAAGICDKDGRSDVSLGIPDDRIFLDVGSVYPYTGLLRRDRSCVDRPVCPDDQHEGVVSLSDGLSVLYDHGKI